MTNATGKLAAPTNFFAANSNLLNQAIAPAPGPAFLTSQFGSDGANTNLNPFGSIVTNLVQGLGNVVQWGSQFLTNWGAHSTNDYMAAQGGPGSNNVLTSPILTNAVFMSSYPGGGPAATFSNAAPAHPLNIYHYNANANMNDNYETTSSGGNFFTYYTFDGSTNSKWQLGVSQELWSIGAYANPVYAVTISNDNNGANFQGNVGIVSNLNVGLNITAANLGTASAQNTTAFQATNSNLTLLSIGNGGALTNLTNGSLWAFTTTNINMIDGTGTSNAIPHGLGVQPTMFSLYLVCTTNDASSGIRVSQQIESPYIVDLGDVAFPACTIWADSTNLYITYDGDTGGNCVVSRNGKGAAYNTALTSFHNFQMIGRARP